MAAFLRACGASQTGSPRPGPQQASNGVTQRTVLAGPPARRAGFPPSGNLPPPKSLPRVTRGPGRGPASPAGLTTASRGSRCRPGSRLSEPAAAASRSARCRPGSRLSPPAGSGVTQRTVLAGPQGRRAGFPPSDALPSPKSLPCVTRGPRPRTSLPRRPTTASRGARCRPGSRLSEPAAAASRGARCRPGSRLSPPAGSGVTQRTVLAGPPGRRAGFPPSDALPSPKSLPGVTRRPRPPPHARNPRPEGRGFLGG